jgi:hypothetical protein
MSTPTVESSTKVTVTPQLCTHCHKASGNPPAWMKLVEAMAPGRGQQEPTMSVSALAEKTGLSRQRVNQLADQAAKAGMLEIPRGISGVRVYRRTPYGRQILGRWKSLGWKGV